MKAHIRVSTPVVLTPRVRQMSGLFDVPLEEKLTLSWDHDLPVEEKPWNVGLIYGPSGAGKTLLANELWPKHVVTSYDWSEDKSVMDGFPDMSIKQITGLFNSVGFGSTPQWMVPFRVLSTGEQFRATIARALAETPGLVVVDEFSSVVDRQVAQLASHTVQKAVRKQNRQLVAVTCHYDVEDWLQPDWAYDIATRKFAWRSVQPHPPVGLEIYPADRSLWPLFARFHYLTTRLHTTAKCFAGYVDGRPVVFTADIYFPHPRAKDIMMGHRIVVLPDWQGLGIASKVTDWQGAYWHEKGYRYRAGGAHPALLHYQSKSPRWRLVGRPPRQLATGKKMRAVRGGLAAHNLESRSLGVYTFEYVPGKGQA
jgi:hypothetical protein